MDRKLTRWLYPLFILLAMALFLRLNAQFMFTEIRSEVHILFTAAFLFTFGTFLGQKKKRNQGWVRKFIVAVVMFFIVTKRLGWIDFDTVWNILFDLGVDTTILNALIVYCGWTFFD